MRKGRPDFNILIGALMVFFSTFVNKIKAASPNFAVIYTRLKLKLCV